MFKRFQKIAHIASQFFAKIKCKKKIVHFRGFPKAAWSLQPVWLQILLYWG